MQRKKEGHVTGAKSTSIFFQVTDRTRRPWLIKKCPPYSEILGGGSLKNRKEVIEVTLKKAFEANS